MGIKFLELVVGIKNWTEVEITRFLMLGTRFLHTRNALLTRFSLGNADTQICGRYQTSFDVPGY